MNETNNVGLSMFAWHNKVMAITNPYGDANYLSHDAIYNELLAYWREDKTPQQAADGIRGHIQFHSDPAKVPFGC